MAIFISMNNTPHTSGPWKHRQEHLYRVITGNHVDYVDGGCCTLVARVEGNATSQQVTLANARLIAAAPDLLASLEEISMMDDLLEVVGPARWNAMAAAIAKARGIQQTAHAGPNGIVALNRHEDQVEARAS